MKQHLDVILPAAPPTAVTTLMFAGIQWSDWVLILNAAYIALGIAYLLYKWVKEHRAGK